VTDRLERPGTVERIAGDEPSLARLAADLGFADHAHLARAVKRETGATLSHLR
jgi:AraC-like DNA-binding protein